MKISLLCCNSVVRITHLSQMKYLPRSVRKYLGIGYGNPKSWSRKFFYSAVLFLGFVIISLLTMIQGSNNSTTFIQVPKIKNVSATILSTTQKQKQRHRRFATKNTTKEIDGHAYPKLTNDGNFIPLRKIVHLDLKGGAYKPSFFPEIFRFFKKIGLTGILIEWEDMFPYAGKLSEAINGDAYSMLEIEGILKSAKENELDIIPLVQTFGHLEWILKLEKFKYLREDPRYPQVICFAKDEAFELIKEMIDQVFAIHKKYGIKFFHMGADEAFHIGICNETIEQMSKEGGSKDRVILWHISRIAKYIKTTYSVTVLAWHDMFGHVEEKDLEMYEMLDVLEPVLWSYPENLEEYLSYSSWEALKPFKNVWGSSAFKGADGPMKYSSNPMHYIRNHESWIKQMTKVYREFDYFQGLIITGWSRYDHMAILTELLPVNLPTLVMCIETIDSGFSLNGNYQKSDQLLSCSAKFEPGYISGCKFPGSKIYELINELHSQKETTLKYITSDFDLNGWLSNIAEAYNFSSPMYIEKISQIFDDAFNPLKRIEKEIRFEMSKIYFNETIDEFILTNLGEEFKLMKNFKAKMAAVLSKDSWPKRPFIKYPLLNDS